MTTRRKPLTLATLVADPLNANRGTARGQDLVEQSLKTYGAARSIVVDRKGRIIGGHKTAKAAAAAGITKTIVVPASGDALVIVQREDLDLERDAKARELAVADNRTGEVGLEWSPEVLRALQAGGADLGHVGFTAAELANLFGTPATTGKTDPDAVPDARPTTIARGDLFQLGRHRLICGDCTQPADVARLLDGVRPDLLAMDPPYCSGGFQEAGKHAGSVGTRGLERVANDALSTRGYVALMKAVFGLFPAKAAYTFTDWRMWVNLFDVAESCGFGVRNMIVWDKESPGMGQGWRHQHELILVGVKMTSPFNPKKAVGNVLRCKRTGNVLHPTQKPVELFERILDVTDWAMTIADPFGGSGSTLIACEGLGRQAFAMELDPRYVQQTIDRWEAFTGKAAEPIPRTASKTRQKSPA